MKNYFIILFLNFLKKYNPESSFLARSRRKKEDDPKDETKTEDIPKKEEPIKKRRNFKWFIYTNNWNRRWKKS